MGLLKKLFFIGIIWVSIPQLLAQQDSQYTQYMYNTTSINPGYSGSREGVNIFGLYRKQWVGLNGAPETLNFSVNSPLSIRNVGAGIEFVSDQIGPSSENTIAANFSYTISIGTNTKLAFGLKAGLNMLDFNSNKLNALNPSDPNLTNQSLSSPVFGFGFYLYNNSWYIGASTPNFLETKHYDAITVSTAAEEMHVYLIGGYVFDIVQNVKLKPAVLLKAVSGAPFALDTSLNVLLYEKLTLGAAYRLDAALSGLAGFQISDTFFVGYAYDYTTSELGQYNSGSHEIFLRFELGKRPKGKVNPRFF